MRFRFENQLLDVDRRELRRDGMLIPLEPQVFDLLAHLVLNRNRVVSKHDLIAAVWNGRIVSESALTSRMTAVRKAVGDTGGVQRLIRTIPRKGVRFVGAVREEAGPGRLQAPRLSIVVLPFANLSDDPEQEYFADAITDDLTTDLTRIAGSFIIARSSAFIYKGQAVDVRQIGRDLGVRYALEGSVRRAGDQVQVNVQLIDAVTGAHIWADRFERDRRNLAVAHAEITSRLAQTLNLELVKDVGRRIQEEKQADPDARDLVMQGWYWLHRPRSAAATEEAQRAFERALAIDPHSVDARIGLARALTVWLVGTVEPRPLGTEMALAERLLLEAIDADPGRSAAHSTMGKLRRVQNRLREARIELETAMALGANDESVNSQYAWTLLLLGEPETGIAAAEKTLRVSPRDPTLWGTYLVLGWCRLLMGEIEPAIDWLMKSLAANPRPWVTHFGLAAALALKCDIAGAQAAIADARKLNPLVTSLARFREYRPWGNAEYWSLFEKTAAVGLRRAGFPDDQGS
jgi:adenylate cyclase